MDDLLKTAVSEILNALKDGDLLSEYDFHLKYSLSPRLIEESIRYLTEMELIEYIGSEDVFSIVKNPSPEKIKSVREQLMNRQFSLDDDYGLLNGKLLSINEPYTPDVELIDKSLKVD